MKYAIVLAAGKGNRFGDELPKQYHLLLNKPVIIHTLEKFINYSEKLKIVLVISKEYIKFVKELIEQYLNSYSSEIIIVEGGNTRMDSLVNACKYIIDNFETSCEDIIITHDAARPFINNRIIRENIEKLYETDAVTTVIPSNDAILKVDNNNDVEEVPIRKKMKLVQTPQTFRLHEFVDIYNTLTKEEIDALVEASNIYIIRNKNVKVVEGEPYNIKITTKFDFEIAKIIINNQLER